MAARPKGRSVSGYGDEYECVVSRRKAMFLSGEYQVPDIGWELCLVAGTYLGPEGHNSVPVHLYLQNVAGTLVVCSAFCPRTEWGKVFGDRYAL